jgi:hypothetical protein
MQYIRCGVNNPKRLVFILFCISLLNKRGELSARLVDNIDFAIIEKMIIIDPFEKKANKRVG